MGVDLGCPQVYESAWNTHRKTKYWTGQMPPDLRTYKKHHQSKEFVQLGCLQVYENQISRTRAGDPEGVLATSGAPNPCVSAADPCRVHTPGSDHNLRFSPPAALAHPA